MQDLFELPAKHDAFELMRKLSQEHKDAIAEEVRVRVGEAVDSFKPHGWGRLTHWLREWGLTGTFIALPLTLFGLLITVSIFAASGISKNAIFQTHTDDRLTGIETRLKSIEAALFGLQTFRTATDPHDKNNQTEAKRVLETAKSTAIRIAAPIIKETGEKFINASATDAGAWDTALSFIDYKSFLDSASLLVLPTPQKRLITHYQILIPEGTQPPQFQTGGAVPKEQAARFITMNGDLNADNPIGNQYVFAQGGNIILDGSDMRSVIFLGVTIFYHGGSLSMDNVYFINCTFKLVQNPKAKGLAMAILEANPTTKFTAS